MRKLTVILPASAILLAAVVLASDFGAPLSAQSPDVVAAESGKDIDVATADDADQTATTWTETGKRHHDSRNPRLPGPNNPGGKKKKKGP